MMVGFGKRLVGAFAAFACLMLAGCGIVADQHPDKVLIRTAGQTVVKRGGEPYVLPDASAYSENYLDYALIAGQTYVADIYKRFASGEIQQGRAYDLSRERFCYEAATERAGCTGGAELAAYAAKRLDRWRLIYAGSPNPSDCQGGRLRCRLHLTSAGVQIWVSKGKVCREAVIAFRGTKFDNFGDWYSNFRWLTQLYPSYDFYDQVKNSTSQYVGLIDKDGCAKEGITKLIAVGHSLGGGLAQQVAYAWGRTRKAAPLGGRFDRVVVFDPSPVTGYFSVKPEDRRANSRDLVIERVYEDGEALAYVRFVLRQLLPLSPCNPQVVAVRFNILQGSAFDQHALNRLASALLVWSKGKATGRTPPQPRPLPPPPAKCPAKILD